jgi:hypothetical protein
MGIIKSRSIIPHSPTDHGPLPTDHDSAVTGIDMISNLSKLVKKFSGKLPLSDYPVLSTFRFLSFWLNFALAPSLMSRRDLFDSLNYQGIKINISTFYQANKMRSTEFF